MVQLEALRRSCRAASELPLPGEGKSNQRFAFLTAEACQDLPLGRLVEAHADALAIIAELNGGGLLDHVADGARWGVWAAGPAASVHGETTTTTAGLRITGNKRWCSGATLLTHALVDVTNNDARQLVAVDLSDPGVEVAKPDWVGHGMERADTRSVRFTEVPAVPIGPPGAYLDRPGFWAGAIGVAACWHGGTIAVAQTLRQAVTGTSDAHAFVSLGAVHAALMQNRAILRHAAHQLDTSPKGSHAVTARVVRHTIERNATEIIDRVGRALGPGPMAHDARHTRAIADLLIYIRQDHAERDLEQLGRDVVAQDPSWCDSG